MKAKQIKIRLTDSLCVAKFTYIKPEVELVFPLMNGDQPVTYAEELLMYDKVSDSLDQAIEMQLERICRRCSAQDFVMIKNSIDVDPRLKKYAEDFQANLKKVREA
jgi:ABC-type cobalamin transport system ATPase subunit